MKLLLITVLTASMTSCSTIPNDFFKNVSVRVKTDAGDLIGGKDGIQGEITIDKRSGK